MLFLRRINSLCARHQGLFQNLITCIERGDGDDVKALQAAIASEDLYGLDGYSLMLILLVCRRIELADCEAFLSRAIFFLAPENTLACLHAIFSLTRFGKTDEARNALQKVTRNNIDAAHFGHGHAGC